MLNMGGALGPGGAGSWRVSIRAGFCLKGGGCGETFSRDYIIM